MQARDQREAIESLMKLERRSLKFIFGGLRPASILEVRGEYDAFMLDQGGPLGASLTRRFFNMKGSWQGKAFRPLSSTTGEGYNTFATRQGLRQDLRMDTSIGPSAIDGQPSFLLNYRAKNAGLARWLVGELRCYRPGVLLGMGTFGSRKQGHRKMRRVIPFALVGPVAEYQQVIQKPLSSWSRAA